MSRKKFKLPPMMKGAYYENFKTAWLPQSRIADIICAVCAAEWDDVQYSARGKAYWGGVTTFEEICREAVKNREAWFKLRRKILMKRKA